MRPLAAIGDLPAGDAFVALAAHTGRARGADGLASILPF